MFFLGVFVVVEWVKWEYEGLVIFVCCRKILIGNSCFRVYCRVGGGFVKFVLSLIFFFD